MLQMCLVIGVVAAGQQAVLTTMASGRPVAMAPQAVMVPTQTVSRLLSPTTSLSANSVQLPATLNVLQRQLSAPGTHVYQKLIMCSDQTFWCIHAFVCLKVLELKHFNSDCSKVALVRFLVSKRTLCAWSLAKRYFAAPLTQIYFAAPLIIMLYCVVNWTF